MCQHVVIVVAQIVRCGSCNRFDVLTLTRVVGHVEVEHMCLLCIKNHALTGVFRDIVYVKH